MAVTEAVKILALPRREAVEEKKVSFGKYFFSPCSFRIQSIILKYV